MIPLRQRAVRETLSQGMPLRRLRGVITKIGRKLFKVLVLPLASELLQNPVRWVAERVEGRLRQPLVWRPTPENYRQAPDPNQPFTDWESLKGGPVLLIVHGIFSSVQGMLARLPRAAMDDWHARYGGRVIAYNHPTVSVSPEENARVLIQQMKAGLGDSVAVVDIVCHSRGGIVSRALAEHGDLLVPGHRVHVRSVYFVATPNAGSPLGDADHMVDMIDLFTNVIGNFDDGPVAYSLEVIVGLVMLVGHAGVKALPGIAALGTEGSYITDVLNGKAARAGLALYAAAASNFEPQPGRENGWLIDRLGDPMMDRIFTRAGVRVPNDLVVPQQGVFAGNGHPSFSIDDPLVYEAEDGVWHSAFFSQSRTLAHLAAHMTRVAAAQAPAPAERVIRLRGRRARTPKPETVRVPGSPAADGPQHPPHGGTVKDMVATQRDPHISFHEQLEAGAEADLTVQLKLPREGAASPDRFTVVFDPGVEEIELEAEISAPGLKVIGPRSRPLTLLRRREPSKEVASFRLKAKDSVASAVRSRIVVTFLRGGEQVGSVTHDTTITPLGYNGPLLNGADVAQPVRIYAVPRQISDLVIVLRRPDPARDHFELSMRAQYAGAAYEARDMGTFNLDGKDLAAWLATYVDEAFKAFPADELSDPQFEKALPKWNALFGQTLADMGKALWGHLPRAFQDEYLRLAGLNEPPRSIAIASDELTFPWELVRPSGKVERHVRTVTGAGDGTCHRPLEVGRRYAAAASAVEGHLRRAGDARRRIQRSCVDHAGDRAAHGAPAWRSTAAASYSRRPGGLAGPWPDAAHAFLRAWGARRSGRPRCLRTGRGYADPSAQLRPVGPRRQPPPDPGAQRLQPGPQSSGDETCRRLCQRLHRQRLERHRRPLLADLRRQGQRIQCEAIRQAGQRCRDRRSADRAAN